MFRDHISYAQGLMFDLLTDGRWTRDLKFHLKISEYHARLMCCYSNVGCNFYAFGIVAGTLKGLK